MLSEKQFLAMAGEMPQPQYTTIRFTLLLPGGVIKTKEICMEGAAGDPFHGEPAGTTLLYSEIIWQQG